MEQNIFTGEQKLLQMHRKGEKFENEGKYKYTVGPAYFKDLLYRPLLWLVQKKQILVISNLMKLLSAD